MKNNYKKEYESVLNELNEELVRYNKIKEIINDFFDQKISLTSVELENYNNQLQEISKNIEAIKHKASHLKIMFGEN